MQTMVHLSKPRNVRQKHTYEVNPLAVPFVKKEVVHVVKKNGVLCFKRRHFKKFEIQKSTLSPEKPEWSERVQLLATPKNPRLQKGPTPESSETRLRKPIDPTQKQRKNIL